MFPIPRWPQKSSPNRSGNDGFFFSPRTFFLQSLGVGLLYWVLPAASICRRPPLAKQPRRHMVRSSTSLARSNSKIYSEWCQFDVVAAKLTKILAFVVGQCWFASRSSGIKNSGLDTPAHWKTWSTLYDVAAPQTFCRWKGFCSSNSLLSCRGCQANTSAPRVFRQQNDIGKKQLL